MSHPLVIVADPPWSFGDKLPGKSRGAAKNYACMGVVDIAKEMAVHTRTSDAVLFCWRVASMQEEAIALVRLLGFTVKSELIWEKLSRSGRCAHFGMGRYVRASHEACLIAVRGRAFPEVRSVRSRFSAPIREHSRKPEEFYTIVERMYPSSSKVELFARQQRPGWECHGLEVGKFDQESA